MRLAPILLLLATLPSGCSSFHRARFNQGEGVGEDAVLAIPFREKDRWYTESQRGNLVSEAFYAWVQKEGHPDPVAGDEVDRVLRQVREWKTDQITTADWQKLTTGLGVKYLLVGDLENVALKGAGNVGILDPTVRASYRLINLETGRLALERKSFLVELEAIRDTGTPTLELGANFRDLELRLLAKLAEQIGRDLYGYYEEW